MKKDQRTSLKAEDVSIASTFKRTGCLIALTLIFMAIVRFCKPISHAMQHLAGTSAWGRLYDLFHISTALGREQLILTGIVSVCFCLALIIQTGVLLGLRYHKKHSHREE